VRVHNNTGELGVLQESLRAQTNRVAKAGSLPGIAGPHLLTPQGRTARAEAAGR